MDGPNPFDQFAEDFRAAIPGVPAPASNESPALTLGPPTPAPASKPAGPPMNAPPPMANMNMQGGQPMYGGYGAPPAGGMYGGPPPMGMGSYPPPMGGPGGPPLNNGMGMLVPAAQQSNPYANMLGAPGGPPPPNQWGAPPAPPQIQQQQPPPPPAASPPMPQGAPALPPASQPQPGALDVWGAAPSGAPPQPSAGAPPTRNFDIFGGGAPPALPPGPPQNASPALSQQTPPSQMAPYQQPPAPPQQPPQPPQDGGFGGLFDPMGSSPAADPWGASTPGPGAIVPSAESSDPFGGIFGSPTPAPPAQAPIPAAAANNDPWGDMGFGTPAPAPPKQEHDDNSTLGGGTLSDMHKGAPANAHPESDFFSSGPTQAAPVPQPEQPKKSQLPEGGEYFDARIFTPTLGVMFFKPQELTDSLFLNTDREVVDALEERPVVAFIVEGSSARSAGVELGNVLLKVNGIDVKNPKEASRLIKEGPRPLPLLFYVPSTTVVVAEGEHMVKYDTRETGAPMSAKDWKPKYVVIGGIIAQPWMMNMYRSKAEYDIAVIETQARRPVSVKVKQFSLQGARIQNDWQGPQMVKYKNKLHPWKFIVVLPVSRNPIKISSTNLSQLKPVHEGIRRVLQAQQRGNTPGVKGPTAAPVKTNDPYENGGAPPGRMPSEGGVGSARRKTAY